MLCNMCGKNEASIHFKQVIAGTPIEMHICQECATKSIGMYKDVFKQVEKMIEKGDLSAFGAREADNKPVVEEMEDITCQKCGRKYSEVLEGEPMGCAMCYEAFLPRLKKPQSATELPFENEKINKLMELNRLLKVAVENENYELAASLRDEINETMSIGGAEND